MPDTDPAADPQPVPVPPPAPDPEPEVIDEAVAAPGSVVATVPAPGSAPATPNLPAGVVPSRNYVQAVELGHVLAASGYYTDARDPAKAAVKVMIGMDLGVSPTAALQGVHAFEDDGKMTFVVEGKLLASVVKARPGYDYRILERTEERVELEFLRDGERVEPTIVWTLEDAKRAGLVNKKNWQRYPREMLTWRALAEGIRLHFPEILGGQPIYTFEEVDADPDEVRLRDALNPEVQPLTDERAEQQRAQARIVYDEIKAVAGPDRLPPGRFHQMISGAEHSHEKLDSVIAALADLRDTEREIASLKAELEEQLPPDEFKNLVARAERRGSNRERIDLLTAALPDTTEAEAPPETEAEAPADAENTDPEETTDEQPDA